MADETPEHSAPAPTTPSQTEPAAPPPPVQQAAPSEPEAPPSPPANLGTQRIHAGLPEGSDVLRLVEKAPDIDRPVRDDTTR